jgi:hypothetical protein
MELQFRVIELFMVLLGCPIGHLSKRFPDQAWLRTIAFIWQILFFACMAVIKCLTGRDPVTDPTAFEKLIELYAGFWGLWP